MGFWDGVYRLGASTVTRFFTPNVTYIGFPGERGGESNALGTQAVGELWFTQPHLRTVVAFRARNVAHIGLHVYKRADDGGRERDRDSVLAQLLGWVDGEMTTYDLLFAMSGDIDLYDKAYLLVTRDPDSPVGWTIRRLPPGWVSENRNALGTRIDSYDVAGIDSSKNVVNIPAGNIIRITGYNPSSIFGCSPTIESLRGTLEEQVEAARYRSQIWKRGGRVSAVLQRPVQAPRWSDAAREAFRTDWYAKFTGQGSMAGGTPILEDGMTLNRIDFNSREQQFVESARLSMTTVASAYFVHPSMIGQADAPYSALRAYKRMLYTETLGPTLAQISGHLNKKLVRHVGLDPREVYVEFNLMEKLSGDFEEQASIMSASTGAPWMTRNEARARLNLPYLDGADELVVPMNVLVGGQASPRDSGTQNEVPNPVEEDRPKRALAAKSSTPWRVKSIPRWKDGKPVGSELVEKRLAEFFQRQARSVVSKLGAGSDAWDADRWDRELSADIFELFKDVSVQQAEKALLDHGLDPKSYDVGRTLKFLKIAAEQRAEAINDAIEEDLEDALDDEEADPEDLFSEDRADGRAARVAVSVFAFAAGFGQKEAASQRGAATKTWVVTSNNPRPSHASMDGETVQIEDDFSNGLKWPGAYGDADEVAGCSCELEINFPD